MANTVTFIAFSCTHNPMQDKQAIKWMIDQIANKKPDYIIHLGDMHEADAASKWGSEETFTLADEYWSSNQMLKSIREASKPDCQFIFLPGNHDANITAKGRLDKKIRDRCDYTIQQHGKVKGDNKEHWLNEELYKYWKIPYRYKYMRCRDRGCFRLGNVVFAHGYEAGVNADKFSAAYLANEYGLYVGGHTHRPTPAGPAQRVFMTQACPMRYYYANPGCMREMDPGYVQRQRHDMWGQGIVYGDTELLKSPRMCKTWNSETIIYRMFDEYATTR